MTLTSHAIRVITAWSALRGRLRLCGRPGADSERNPAPCVEFDAGVELPGPTVGLGGPRRGRSASLTSSWFTPPRIGSVRGPPSSRTQEHLRRAARVADRAGVTQ